MVVNMLSCRLLLDNNTKFFLFFFAEQARLNVWVLDGDQSHTGLLKYALTEENFEDTMVLLVASMAQPWSVAETLNKWVTVLSEHIDKLRIPPEKMREYEQSCEC